MAVGMDLASSVSCVVDDCHGASSTPPPASVQFCVVARSGLGVFVVCCLSSVLDSEFRLVLTWIHSGCDHSWS